MPIGEYFPSRNGVVLVAPGKLVYGILARLKVQWVGLLKAGSSIWTSGTSRCGPMEPGECLIGTGPVPFTLGRIFFRWRSVGSWGWRLGVPEILSPSSMCIMEREPIDGLSGCVKTRNGSRIFEEKKGKIGEILKKLWPAYYTINNLERQAHIIFILPVNYTRKFLSISISIFWWLM